MRKFIDILSSLFGVLIGAAFLNGAGVAYESWYSLPVPLSKVVVTVLTLAAFVKISLLVVSYFVKNKNQEVKD